MTDGLERKLTRIFRQSGRAISSDTLTFITNSHERDVWEKLKAMEKYGIIKAVTEKRVRFYRANP
jgi:acetolactate synthase small subunit